MSAVQIKVGRDASKMDKNLLEVIHVLEDPQQADRLRMWKVYGLNPRRWAVEGD